MATKAKNPNLALPEDVKNYEVLFTALCCTAELKTEDQQTTGISESTSLLSPMPEANTTPSDGK